MKLRDDIKEFLATIPSNVKVVAATKYVDATTLKEMLKNNMHDFGENRVDAFLEKYYELIDEDISWHFIGHLQRNKAKDIINKIAYLHSLDSLKLADIIEKELTSPLKVFVEVSINLEENKNGVPYYELKDFLSKLRNYKKIEVVGLMMMTIKYSSEEENLSQFRKLRELRDKMEKELNISLPYLSMGMSDDYKYALKEGATHLRLGRILFKE